MSRESRISPPAPGLTISDHSVVTSYLKDLGNAELMTLGGALGLDYPHLQRMAPLMSEMVAAWLRSEDQRCLFQWSPQLGQPCSSTEKDWAEWHC